MIYGIFPSLYVTFHRRQSVEIHRLQTWQRLSETFVQHPCKCWLSFLLPKEQKTDLFQSKDENIYNLIFFFNNFLHNVWWITSCLFQGSGYWQWDEISPTDLRSYPKPIGHLFKGLPSHSDAALAWTDGHVYVFKGSELWRVNQYQQSVAKDYPLDIASNWMQCDDWATRGHPGHEPDLGDYSAERCGCVGWCVPLFFFCMLPYFFVMLMKTHTCKAFSALIKLWTKYKTNVPAFRIAHFTAPASHLQHSFRLIDKMKCCESFEENTWQICHVFDLKANMLPVDAYCIIVHIYLWRGLCELFHGHFINVYNWTPSVLPNWIIYSYFRWIHQVK